MFFNEKRRYFINLNEVLKFEDEDEFGYVCPMKIDFGRWLNKWAIKLEKSQ